MFDLLIGTSNPGMKLDAWEVGGVQFERSRHSFSSRSHSFSVDIFMLTRPGIRGWQLLVTKEYWWAGRHKRPIKTQRWSQPIGGSRRDIMTWLREREQALESET
jgi:hypothetical protein